MIYEILFSVVGVLMILLFIMIDKYRKQLNRANKWKSDYFAIKSTLDRERNNADKLPFDKDWYGYHPMDVNEEYWKYETRKRSDDVKPKKKSFKDIDIAAIAAKIEAEKEKA